MTDGPAEREAPGVARPILGPRDRIVASAVELIRTQGVSGTGLREVVSRAGAPRGSLQHYFPGGKDQLVTEALVRAGGVAGRRVQRVLDRLEAKSPGALLAGVAGRWREELLRDGFEAGCPLVAAAGDVAAANDTLRAAVAQGLDGWERPLCSALAACGVPEARAPALAVLVISALEGAIVLARVRHDVAALDVVVEELAPVLDAVAAGR